MVYGAYTTGFIIACVLFGFKLILFPFFQTTLLPFNIDQLIGSPSDELSAIIHWHRIAVYFSTLLISILNVYTEIFTFQWISLTIFCFCIVAVLFSHSLFNSHLDTTPVSTTNPIKLIVRVLCYARKHKYPENRSALTYWEEEAPSRLDLGKDKYGGPFTEEEVEDVKTVLRLIPLFICVAAIGFEFQIFSDSTSYFAVIMVVNNRSTVPIACILVYQFLFYPCFYHFIPNLLKRISFGLLLILTSSLIYTAISLSSYFHSAVYCINPNIDTINASTSYYSNDSYSAPVMALIVNEWMPLGAGILYGFADYFIRVLSIELTLAQSPKGLRGTMLGLLGVSKGLATIISLLIDLAFQHYLFTYSLCSFYLFLVKTISIFFIALLFFWLARRYKYRVRSSEINVHNIAENHIAKFINQSLEYRRRMEYLSTTESLNEVN
uniref:Major facilitator superfamily associated domain-containing protein n=1 Tax=Amphimedon queenslandica TaxID=400682 RepID=A0A1X7VD41_AMPQE